MNVNKEVHEIVSLGRDQIIDIAIKKIQNHCKNTISKGEFHFIEVVATKSDVKVELGYNVSYYPLVLDNQSFKNIKISILNFSPLSIDCSNLNFHKPDHPHRDAIDFVIRNLYSTSRSFDTLKNASTLMSISEEEDHYQVNVGTRNSQVNGGSFSRRRVHKVTGKVTGKLLGTYARNPHITLISGGYKIRRKKFSNLLNVSSNVNEDGKWIEEFYYLIH